MFLSVYLEEFQVSPKVNAVSARDAIPAVEAVAAIVDPNTGEITTPAVAAQPAQPAREAVEAVKAVNDTRVIEGRVGLEREASVVGQNINAKPAVAEYYHIDAKKGSVTLTPVTLGTDKRVKPVEEVVDLMAGGESVGEVSV